MNAALKIDKLNLNKQDSITFCANLPKKERGSVYGNVMWQWPKKEKISFYGNVTRQWPKKMRI